MLDQDQRGFNSTRPTIVFLLGPTKPLLLYDIAYRQDRTGDLALVKSRELAGRSQTLPWWWLGGEGIKTTENKIHWTHKVHLYLARVPQRLSPVRIGTLLPHPRVYPPPRNQRGGHTRLRMRGWGVPIRTTGEKA
jgi:hypothetical protein